MNLQTRFAVPHEPSTPTEEMLMALPRQIAVAIVAQEAPAPELVVDVGAYVGEGLEVFLDAFPSARGQWTDATDNNLDLAKARLARFGDRVDYVVGAPRRDVSDGSVPDDVGVLLTSWVSHHRDRAGLVEFYAAAAARLTPGGWLVNLDHVRPDDDDWERRITEARATFGRGDEGPPMHHDGAFSLASDHIDALAAAGIRDVDVVWRAFDACLFVGRR